MSEYILGHTNFVELKFPEKEKFYTSTEISKELMQDGRRFQWYFDDNHKNPEFANEYLKGVREKWSIDQWRTLIDKYMNEDLK